MNNSPIKSALLGVALLGLSLSVQAIPTLQLGIAGGTYDNVSKTIIASSNAFSLYAYLIPDSDNSISETYKISMAITPQVSSPQNLGSFTVNGNVIDATSGMNYGIPPADLTVETTYVGDSHDLPSTVFSQRIFPKSLSLSVLRIKPGRLIRQSSPHSVRSRAPECISKNSTLT